MITHNVLPFIIKNKGVLIMAKDDRFIKSYSQGKINVFEVWIDTQTGVNYLAHKDGYSGGLTPLLDKEGKPVITSPDQIKFLMEN